MVQQPNTPPQQAHAKLTQIFRYVQAFNHLQNPVQQDIEKQSWVLWLYDLPRHSCVRSGLTRESTAPPSTTKHLSMNEGMKETELDDFILKVKRPRLTDPPAPPSAIAPWLQDGWQDVEGSVTLDTKRTPAFQSDPRRIELFKQWSTARNQWLQTERPARQTMQLFDRLYALHAQLEREAERIELMLGEGIIDWSPRERSESLYHPLLLLRLQLHFDAQIPEFTLSTTEHPPELYTALLQSISEVNTTSIGRCRQEFEQAAIHPLGGDETSQFLQRLVNQLSPRGEFSPQYMPRTNGPFPLITRNPVIFLRNRAIGFNTALEAILQALPHQTQVSPSLLSLTGISEHSQHIQHLYSEPTSLLASLNGEDERILFSKPANAEQLEVAKRLEHTGAVLVQGPPGTGKTHTIANLIGHLLAQGKSVLVTSHTSKALKVLHEKVVEPLQPLCVSILEDDTRKEMERAIDAITEQLSSLNIGMLEQQAAQLTQQRIRLISQLRKIREQLKEARDSEYREIVVEGKAYTPSNAARHIARYHTAHSWLPAPIKPEHPLPLTLDELTTLYRTNISVTPGDEREMTAGLPNPHKLASAVDFEQWVAARERILKEDLDFRKNLWITVPNPPSISELRQVQHQLIQALEPLQDTGQDRHWRLTAIAAGREGGLDRQIWDDLIRKIEHVDQLAKQAQPLLLEYDPYIPDNSLSTQTEHLLQEIINHLDNGGHLNKLTWLFHRDWKVLLEQLRVNGQPPETKEHMVALLTQVELTLARHDLAGRWQRQMTVLGAPDASSLGPTPERVCRQYIYQLRQCLTWFEETWAPLEQELKRYGLQWDTIIAEMPANLNEHGDLLRLCDAVQQKLPPILAAEINRHIFQANDGLFIALRRTLDANDNTQASTEVIQRLRSAIDQRNAQTYREAFTRLTDLYERQRELHIRQELLNKLQRSAPGWAEAIRHREGVHGTGELPGDPQEAWHWQQLRYALDYRSKLSLETLQEQSIQLSDNLHSLTAELVEKRAWAAQIRRTSLEQRRALQGWKEIMRKVGKGTGKRAATLLAEARRLMPMCQSAVPVWIMPLNRVVQNFDPRTNHFDVVIIDEASQADVKALAAIYMGERMVIVGDDEQVTPLDVGQKLERVDKLINEHLQGIPLATLYDGRLSIYTLAKTADFDPVCLQEHFRCVSPIIQFSNTLSYNGKIKPLRDDSEVKRRPATVEYRVQTFASTSQINEREAEAIASLLVAATEQSEYQDASFGVITMVGKDQQALYIDTLLRQFLSASAYVKHQILCGNPAQFQGDERDVIFISMVDTPQGGGPLSLKSEEANEYMYKKRFNVAASRARDQLWVVHSLDPQIDLKDGDIRKRLILHVRNPQHLQTQLALKEQNTESEFEKQVLRKLVLAGYHVVPQWPVGAYRIDLVVEGDGKRLAVECDGDRFHPITNIEQDMARQAILERLGWRFVRIRGSHFFRNPDQAMAPVFARLQALEIPPTAHTYTEQAATAEGQELHNRIVNRAAELRLQWNHTKQRSSTQTVSLSSKQR